MAAPERRTLQRWSAWWCSLIFLLPPLAQAAKKASFGVRTKILSGWRATPEAAQSLEWLREVGTTDTGAYLRKIAANATAAAPDAGGIEAAAELMQSRAARTFHELVVLNSYYSPRIEMLRAQERRDRQQYGSECVQDVAWALLWSPTSSSPQAACTPEALSKAFKAQDGAPAVADVAPSSNALGLRSFDVLLRHGSSDRLAVLHGALSAEGLQSLAKLLEVVEALAPASKWRVAFRHGDGPAPVGRPDADALTGFGFELAIKSSEYKTHAEEQKDDGAGDDAAASDDSAADDASSGGEDAEVTPNLAPRRELDGPLELDGLLFHVLLKRHEAIGSQLWAFKEQLELERDTDAVLKAWEIKDIGLQATARVKASSAPLLTLMRLSQNFPAHVVSLSRSPVSEKLRKSGKELRKMIREQGEIFSLNGRMLRADHSDLSLFPLMNTLLPSFIGIERLVRIGLPETLACDLLNKAQGSSAAPDRLDWRSPLLPAPIYHVQKDKKTQRWGTSLQSLLYVFPGSLAPVRLPVYQVVFVLNPQEVADLRAAQSLIANMPLPVRLHLVLAASDTQQAGPTGPALWNEEVLGKAPSWVTASGSMAKDTQTGSKMHVSIGKMLSASFAAHLEESPARARKYLKVLSAWAAESYGRNGRIPDGDESAVAQVQKLWIESMPTEAQKEGAAAWQVALKSGLDANASAYHSNLGAPVPSMLVNGKLLLKGSYESDQSILPIIAEEQMHLQRAVYSGRIRSEADIETFLGSRNFAGAYHEEITPELVQRGGEEGGGGMSKKSSQAVYIQWPAQAFLDLPAVHSIERDQGPAGQRLGLFHVVVIRSTSQFYLLRVFAEHLLQPSREGADGARSSASSKLPPMLSHLSVLIGGSSSESAAADALHEVAACVQGVMNVDVASADKDLLNKQKLLLLKFLGMALPAASGSGQQLQGSQAKELCDLGISKKIDPDWKESFRNQVESSRGASSPSPASAAIWDFLASDSGSTAPGLWVCNGRKVLLQDGKQPLSAQLVKSLEVGESQYDVASVAADDDDEETQEERAARASNVQPLNVMLATVSASMKQPLPLRAHGLVAAIRAEALSEGRANSYTAPEEVFQRAPAAFQLRIPPALPEAAVPIRVYGIMDPLSQIAQSATAALALLGMAFNAEVNLVLNPVIRHSEYPLKRYYREVIQWPARLADGRALAAMEDGQEVGGGAAELAGLATAHTLTAAVHVMPTWLVQAYEAEHDMDNLRLVDVGDGSWCEATYVLRQLYVEGQAFILGPDGFPEGAAKGVQIDVHELGAELPQDDAFVMGNLGYFQVHGLPGHYQLKLKPGLSNDTFEVASEEALEVATYITPPHQFRVRLKSGRSHDDLFGKDASTPHHPAGFGRAGVGGSGGGGFFSRVAQSMQTMFSSADAAGKEGDTAMVQQQQVEQSAKVVDHVDDSLPTVHVFSIASGHLYEKLLGIMMLSVRNRTRCPLHFWFIDNFLSPKFKAFIPQMAKEYDFAVDFVTYKWPSWLNPQSEKQRLIWAYKVLFLDVLFPLEVEKIVFIDADQVVRADVLELWNMDLHGKVYGFVPMGDTNPDTEGFRFWKQGYWKNHLGGKPYHISALYVVDLAEFRRTATGDQLRGTYNQLSRDPNSLSNLEQDLINFAQHQVPIHSLPPEWLWCETWCSQESKPKAKTIDLCQNPLTKEPKIVMAKRIIAEWQTYHDEVQRFQHRLLFSGLAELQPNDTNVSSGAAGGRGKLEL